MKTGKLFKTGILSIFFIVAMIGCHTDSTGTDTGNMESPEYFGLDTGIHDPDAVSYCYSGANDEWNIETPESHGISADVIKKADAAVFRLGGRQGYLLIHNDALIHEKYYYGNKDTLNIAWSVTKSFGATLIGIACTMGLLDLDDPVSMWIEKPYYAIHEQATIRHLLCQTAESDPPGAEFKYDSALVINTLSAIVSRASGMPAKDFAKKYLMDPLGIKNYIWLGDLKGNVFFGAGLKASCRSLARLGQLYCNGGVWNGERILSREFINEATTPSFPEANAGYGFLFWLNHDAGTWYSALGTKGTGRMIRDAPENSFRAQGFFGQIINIIPDLNVVAVTMGTTLNIESLYINRQFWNALEPVLLSIE